MLLYEKSKMHNVLPSYIRMGTVKNVRCVCVFVCISKKNNTVQIKQETNGNYLRGSEKKERQEQDRSKKVEKQVEMYTFICTCFLIF